MKNKLLITLILLLVPGGAQQAAPRYFRPQAVEKKTPPPKQVPKPAPPKPTGKPRTATLAIAEPPPLRTFYIDNTDPAKCADAAGYGATPDKPYCSVKSVATWLRGGDLFIVNSRLDCGGPTEFTRAGSATAPVIFRTTVKTILASCTDVNDEDFKPTATPGVFTLAGAQNGVVWQTYYPPIKVEDPNGVKYDMVQSDGPMQLSAVPDDATLAAVEGSYRWVNGVMSVHPYGSVTPSRTNTDFVIGWGRALNTSSSAKYYVWDGFTITYSGSVYTFQQVGSPAILRNIRYVGVPLTIRGTGTTTENVSITHVHARDVDSKWTWHFAGIGTAGTVGGYNHVLRKTLVFHNWNSGISTETATGTVFEGFTAHGSPNHCGVGDTGNTVVRNAIMYNCEDYIWTTDVLNMTWEHITVAGSGIGLEATARTLGPIVVRNSILKGDFAWIRGDVTRCTWEKGSLIENNVFHTSATIEHCDGVKAYPAIPHAQYEAQCKAGTFTNCATFRNNKYVTDWKTVLKDGMYADALGDKWDVTLVPGSPAIDIGASTTPTDILGVARPQGATSDAGIYEYKNIPVDCVVSEWSPWAATGPPTFANWAQTLTQTRTRTVTTPASNGGKECEALTDTRTVAQPCETITVSPSLQVTCNVSAVGVQKK